MDSLPTETTWRYGPASYWYEHNEPNAYLLTKPEAKVKS
jgi:hypothetical protein